MEEKRRELAALIPGAPDFSIRWDRICGSGFGALAEKMAATQQNPKWHAEGDVWTHTRMVCEELVSSSEFRRLARRQQEEVFLAALLHDIGKIPCTRLEDGNWTSPNHAVVGARMARALLWENWGLCGTREAQVFRETVCLLIRCHAIPLHILEKKHSELLLMKTAADGELAPDFSLELLCLLSGADLRGRIGEGSQDQGELAVLCAELAREYGCLTGPWSFPGAVTARAYLSGRKVWKGQELFDDMWGEVLLMCGLPGTGKDTWIREHRPGLPVISLDKIREELGAGSSKQQTKVVSAAKEQAKEYLRAKVPFVWNATCLTPVIREGLVNLFEQYHAAVRIVFLETAWEEGLARNGGRARQVPEPVIREMLGQLVPPRRYEARTVEWNCV